MDLLVHGDRCKWPTYVVVMTTIMIMPSPTVSPRLRFKLRIFRRYRGAKPLQHLLLSLHGAIEAAALRARTLGDDELSNWAPGLSLFSMQHETQFCRVFRS